jgi:hypothetical protein
MRSESLERARGHDVAGVQRQVSLFEQPYALLGQSSSAAREVRVGDDCDERQRYFLRLRAGFAFLGFAFFGAVTRNGLLTKTFVRVAFVSACRSTASV